MANLIEAQQTEISERMIEAGRRYLGRSGALDDPSLVLYRGFVQHMLEKTIEQGAESWDSVSESMEDRAMEYISRYFVIENPSMMTERNFVQGLLSYALLGEEPPIGSISAPTKPDPERGPGADQLRSGN
jgi:hypothetical protein